MDKDTSGQRRYFEAVYDAVDESIKHWNRICAYIKAEMYDGDNDIDGFDAIEYNWKLNYGDTVHSNTCPLCMIYENSCDECILKEKGHECNYENGPWYLTVTSESWEEMLENAQDMVRLLKGVKRDIVEEHQC